MKNTLLSTANICDYVIIASFICSNLLISRGVGGGGGGGGQVGARALGHRPWGRNSTLFAVILNVF